MKIIDVKGLSKDYKVAEKRTGWKGPIMDILVPKYKMIKAVDNISFSIEKGEQVAFLGPNGAGKSTTIKSLTGILHPSAGNIQINGFSPMKDRKKMTKDMGIVFGQKTQLWWDLPVEDSFDLLKSIYKIPETVYQENISVFNEILDLNEFFKQPVRQLSLGQRMRADIAASLLHNPKVVLFDEPTIGLDIVAKDKIRNFLSYISDERDTTMLFTTHDMGDIEKVCKRLIIIDHGKLIYDGTIDNIKRTFGSKSKLVINYKSKFNFCADKAAKLIKIDKNTSEIEFDKKYGNISKYIWDLHENNIIADLKIEDISVEQIVKSIYENGIEIEAEQYECVH